MRILKLTLGWTLMGSLLATSAMAQSASGPTLGQPQSVRATAFEYDNYLSFAPTDKASKSPSDVAAPAAVKAAVVAPTVTAEPAMEAVCCDDLKNEPRRLIGDTGCAGIKVNGYVDMGGTMNANDPGSRYNGTLAPNDRNEFQFNQVYLTFERALNLEENCWDFGGRVDMLYGTDYIYGQSTGLETTELGAQKWNSSKQYGLAMPQIYGEVGHGQLSLKVGHFYTIIGYESLMSTSNFFYSHNYAVRYAEPTGHTGGLFTWKNSDELSLFFGGVNGQDRFDGQEDSMAVLTGFAYTPTEKKYAVNFGLMTGGKEPTTVDGQYAPRTYFSSVFTYNFTDALQSVSQWDAGWQDDYNRQGDTANFWSYTQYLFYTLNPCWKAGVRYDYFSDDQGTRLGGLRYGGQDGGNPLDAFGYAGQAQAISMGLNWTPNNNIRLRPELRWDWHNGPDRLFQVGDNGESNGMFTAACDLVIQF